MNAEPISCHIRVISVRTVNSIRLGAYYHRLRRQHANEMICFGLACLGCFELNARK